MEIVYHRNEYESIYLIYVSLGYSPEKILEEFLIKLAEFYDYKLSPNFLEKYKKELPHSPSYYENDYQFYRNRKKNYF